MGCGRGWFELLAVESGISWLLRNGAVFVMKLNDVASEERCLRPTKLRRVVVFGRQELPEMGPDLQKKPR
jgi:hypothetical protein